MKNLRGERMPYRAMKYVEGSKGVFLNTGTRFPRELVWAVGMVKCAAARANVSLGQLDADIGNGIAAKAKEVAEGRHDAQVVVDVFQTGSGTGLNMNINELVAELASQSSGKSVHPNDHVNMSQSSNDVGPTAVRMAAVYAARRELVPEIETLVKSLSRLSRRTARVYKAGRTHLRDALPVTLGQEFGAYEDAFERDSKIVRDALKLLVELPIGGTAVGTGLNADPMFGEMVVKELRKETGIGFVCAKNRFRAIRLLTDVLFYSGTLRTLALDMYRLCQDLRLMYSGPFAGLREVDIPTQGEVAGSSIMPGKTNPVTVESALLACAQVVGLDAANQFASALGEFELAMGVPIMGYNVVVQTRLMSEAIRKVSGKVIDELVPMSDRLRRYAESSQALITIVSPRIGYDRAATLGKRLSAGLSIREALRELGYTDREIDSLLDMKKLVRPGFPAKED